MKVDEIRDLPNEELRSRLEEIKEELFNLRFQGATGQLENYKRLGLLRRTIARFETVLRERELGIQFEPARQEVSRRRRRRPAEEEPGAAEEPPAADGPEEQSGGAG